MSTLPKFLFVVHTVSPKCIFECGIDDDFFDSHNIHWLDTKPSKEDDIKALIDLAEKFLDDELENQEELYDNEEE